MQISLTTLDDGNFTFREQNTIQCECECECNSKWLFDKSFSLEMLEYFTPKT